MTRAYNLGRTEFSEELPRWSDPEVPLVMVALKRPRKFPDPSHAPISGTKTTGSRTDSGP
jgi:hypothetical protein